MIHAYHCVPAAQRSQIINNIRKNSVRVPRVPATLRLGLAVEVEAATR